MKYFRLRLCILLCLCGCISEIDIAEKGEKRLIIGGVISNSLGERSIRVQETNGLDTLAIPVNASGVILKNGEVWASLTSPQIGELVLPTEYQLEDGASYQAEITTSNGRVFRSFPQIVQPIFQPDSLSFRITTQSTAQEDGSTQFAWVVQLFAHLTLDETELPSSYFRWQIDNSWSFRDWRDTLCYLTESVRDFDPVILSGRKVRPGNQEILVASRPLGAPFIETYYFNSYLHTVDSSAYEYYDKSLRLVQNQGAIFDEVPAAIQGNIREIVDNSSSLEAIGFIEFSLVDTTRLRINRGDFTFQLTNPCDGWVCIPFDTVCLCEDCGKWFEAKENIETETPPPYWE